SVDVPVCGPDCVLSGKGAGLPEPPPLRTARSCSHACSSSIGQLTTSARGRPHWPCGRPGRYRVGASKRSRWKPHQQERCAPLTDLLCFLKPVGPPFPSANTRGSRPAFAGG